MNVMFWIHSTKQKYFNFLLYFYFESIIYTFHIASAAYLNWFIPPCSGSAAFPYDAFKFLYNNSFQKCYKYQEVFKQLEYMYVSQTG